MVRKAWGLLVFVFLSASAINAIAAEVGLVTVAHGQIKLQEEKSAAADLKPFVKLRSGDRITLANGARLQMVYFEGGRQETWQGAGALEVGTGASTALKGGLQPEVKTLPPILVKQLSKTPGPDGNVKAGMIRMRSMPAGGTLESVEKNYAELRGQADPADRNPELYLLASYFELREFDKVDALLQQLGDKSPNDPEVKVLAALYKRAVGNVQASMKK